MPDSLNVIALISGGKDSFFSMIQCTAVGHHIIALANLHPQLPQSTQEIPANKGHLFQDRDSQDTLQSVISDDIDSFMYQTAGHTLIPLYASTLGLPLYRQVITGNAINSSKDYSHQTKPDDASTGVEDKEETECLMPLLEKVMAAHPEANAVCSGAILSTYQRTRIESVAIRLGLIPLSYLWQYPTLPPPAPERLLEDMAEVGFEIRLVKVASGGLDHSMLWLDLMDSIAKNKIARAMKRFGGSVLGEGGEYETIVVDGPSPMWKSRIDVDETCMQKFIESGGTASLVFSPGAGQTVKKESGASYDWQERLRRIPLWDPEFEKLKRDFRSKIQEAIFIDGDTKDEPISGDLWEPECPVIARQTQIGSLLYISNLISPILGANAPEQMAGINEWILDHLCKFQICSNDIIFTTMILRSIWKDFVAVNQIYGQLFTAPNPPARVTISSSLPKGVNVMVSIVIKLESDQARDGLHVQSRSFWAPANIGPYSQAISTQIHSPASIVHIAGQIPLIPATMEPLQLEDHEMTQNLAANCLLSFHQNACISLQHLWRIGREMSVGWWTGAVAYITDDGHAATKARMMHSIWRSAHDRDLWTSNTDEIDVFDSWDKTYGNAKCLAGEARDTVVLPDFARLSQHVNSVVSPGLLAVQVDELPRNCVIEWQSLGIAQADVHYEEIHLSGTRATRCVAPSADLSVSYIYVPKSFDGEYTDQLTEMIAKIRACTPDLASSMTIYTPDVTLVSKVDAQVVPCKAVWGFPISGSEELAAGIVMHSYLKQGESSDRL